MRPMGPADRVLLRVERLRAGYGRVQVLWDVDLHVDRGEIVCLVGANGAGKTTLLRAITGGIPAPRAGGRDASGGRDDGRRGAADAGRGAVVDGAAEDAAGGRAVAGTGSRARAGSLRGPARDQPPGGDEPPARAERPADAPHGPTGLRPRGRPPRAGAA